MWGLDAPRPRAYRLPTVAPAKTAASPRRRGARAAATKGASGAWFLVLGLGATLLAGAACGARTGLPVDERRHRGDAGADAVDAPDEGADAGPDGDDGAPDVVDAGLDALSACADAGITYVYVITEENLLFRFYPPDHSFVEIGQIACPAQPNATPFSMAVDRQGTAYVVFSPSGELFHVSTATAACKPTSFVTGQHGFTATFGMGFSADVNDPGETLYVASDTPAKPGAPAERLATIDPQTFQLDVVGQFSHPIGNAELTGTGDARLFGFGIDSTGTGVVLHLAQIQKTNAQILGDTFLDLGTGGKPIVAWAFAYWGGDFYFFTSTTKGSSKVSRYHPGDTQATDFAQLDKTIVGAGVSTCAPQ